MDLITSLISCVLQIDRLVGGIHSFFKAEFIQSDNNWSHAPDDLKGWLVWEKRVCEILQLVLNQPLQYTKCLK